MNKSLIALCVVGLLGAPTAAYAVYVSSGDGSGEQHVKYWLAPHGAFLEGTLKSTKGSAVYYQGAGTVLGGNTGYNRYTGNVSSTNYVNVGGAATGKGYSVMPSTGVATKVCKVRGYGLPDACGSSVGIPRK